MEQLNFKTKLLIDDLNFFQDTVNYELLERMKMIIGSYRAIGAAYGIVAEQSPIIVDSTQPLQVTKSGVALKIDVSAGAAVTRAGEILIQSSSATEVSLADSTEGIVNLIIAEFLLEETDPRPSIYDEVIIYAKQVRGTIIKSITLAQYNDINIFPTTRRENSVVLAACSVYKDSSGILQTSIDMSRDVYSYNRPWFSPVDIEHRKSVGSGSVTTKNAHGLAYSDLTSGNLTIYQQLLSRGVVISKDSCIPNRAGCAFTESFSLSSVFTDVSGALTGTPNTLYVRVSNYPLQILCVYETAVPQNKFAGRIIEGTNIVAFSKYDVTAAVTIRYLYSKAAQPPTTLLNNLISVQQPISSEIIVGVGKEFSQITNPTINFEASGPIPFLFRVYMDSNGQLLKNPFVILPAIKLEALSVPYIFDTSLVGESKIIVGLTQANSGCTIVLKIIGTDYQDTQITENITFDSTWIDSVIPAASINAAQFKKSVNKYKTISSLEVVSRTGDGNNSTIIAYAEAVDYFYEALLIYEVFWNGLALSKILDKRKIIPYLGTSPAKISEESPIHTAFLLNAVDPVNYPFTSQTYRFATEDFMYPQYIDGTGVDSSQVQPVGKITFNVLQLSVGDTITVAAGKTIIATASGTGNPNIGEFDLDTNETTVRDNIIGTINNTTFLSTVTAVSGGNNIINLTASTIDTNFLITKTSFTPTAIAITGFKNGFKLEKSIIRDRFIDYIDTDLPVPTPEVVADKYRSIAFSIAETTVTKLLVVGYGVDNFYGLYGKATYQGRTDVWQPQITATSVIKNVWLLTFPYPIAKFYIEFFGTAKGYAIYPIL